MPATPRKPVSASSRAKVDFDFNAADADPDAPMAARLPSGTVIHLRNIQDVDWQVAASLSRERPYELFDAIVLDEDRETFLAEKITQRQLDKFSDAYLSHFGMVPPGEPDA